VTALRFTAQYGHEELTRFLLDKGADPNLNAKDGMDPLLAAVQMGHQDIVVMLMDAGANVNTRSDGMNAVMVAREKGHLVIAQILIERGAKEELKLWERRKCVVS
jgi:ankyrin repeat protein